MAGETPFVRRALDYVTNLGVLSPESRAVQADILKQRALRYDKFMETVPGYKGMVNLAPNAAPVVRLENGAVAVLPKGGTIPKGAQVLNKTRSEIDNIVYNVPKEYSPEFIVGTTAAIPAVPALLAAGASGEQTPTQPQDPSSFPSTSPMGDVQAPATSRVEGPITSPNEPRRFSGMTMADTVQPGYHSERAEEGPQQPYGDVYQPNEPRRFPTINRALNVAGRAASSTAGTEERPTPEPSALASIMRGRFGEAGKGSPMDDRLTAFQEARDRMEGASGRATGGAVDAKGGGKDAALHKALEIIHHLISTR